MVTKTTFAKELRRTPVNVPRAALCFAREIAYPELDIAVPLAGLDRLADQAKGFMADDDPISVRAELLAEFLFQHLGFRGNVLDYSDPDNSYLNVVLERRLGIPISLSVLYVAVARRLGLPANGVGLPGHFIVSVNERGINYLFDPFHGGGRLSIADCARLVAQTTGYDGPFRQQWLNPARAPDILTRMLNNLRATYLQREGWAEALAVIERLRQIQPDRPEYLRDMGLVHYRAGSLHLSVRWLEAYLAEFPEAPDAAAIRQGFQSTLDEWVKMN